MGIPCSHKISQLIIDNKHLQTSDFHQRWRFVTDLQEGFSETKAKNLDQHISPVESKLAFAGNQLLNAAHTDAQKSALAQSLLDVAEKTPLVLYDPHVMLDGKGTPSKAVTAKRQKLEERSMIMPGDTSTQRIPSSWERVIKSQQPPSRKVRRCGSCNQPGHTYPTCPQQQNRLLVPSNEIYSSSAPSSFLAVPRPLSATLSAASSAGSSAVSSVAHSPIIYEHSECELTFSLDLAEENSATPQIQSPNIELLSERFALPNAYHESDEPFLSGVFSTYISMTNMLADGHCGFRAISYKIYGDQNCYVDIRQRLLTHLNSDILFYAKETGVEGSTLQRTLIGGENSYNQDYWFSTSYHAALTADTFQLPVLIATRRQSRMEVYAPRGAGTWCRDSFRAGFIGLLHDGRDHWDSFTMMESSEVLDRIFANDWVVIVRTNCT